jgi:hypothetical protein
MESVSTSNNKMAGYTLIEVRQIAGLPPLGSTTGLRLPSNVYGSGSKTFSYSGTLSQ